MSVKEADYPVYPVRSVRASIEGLNGKCWLSYNKACPPAIRVKGVCYVVTQRKSIRTIAEEYMVLINQFTKDWDDLKLPKRKLLERLKENKL
jgi:hypothetical protein